QAEDGIRDLIVTGVQTCALPIWRHSRCDTIDINCWQGNPSVCLRRNERRPMKVEIAKKIRGAIKLRFKNGPTLCFGCCRGCRSRSEERRVGKECRVRWAGDR